MVENDRECTLQWSGHAGYMTEKFSSLLARQALVDVTLICEEQKLRVHKLVLASNSAYFEEILGQDLGHEPIIFLRDLNFEILKAMVEFMYCGETTISQQRLPSLLSAAKIFKVKELACVIDALSEPEEHVEESKRDIASLTDTSESDPSDSCDDNECTRDRCSKPDADNVNHVGLPERKPPENNVILNNTEQQLKHVLYDDSCAVENNADQNNGPLSVSCTNIKQLNESCKSKVTAPSNEHPQKVTMSDTAVNDQESKLLGCEQCCDFSETSKCEQTSMSLSQSCLQEADESSVQCSAENNDVPNKVEKCVKVYTHKKRKSVDKADNNAEESCNFVPSLPPTTDCIDLLEEPSSSNVPVTLLTSLDMESAEYILSLSTENIQSILGCAMSDQNTLIKYKGENVDNDKRALNLVCDKPVLRRSTRLHQQENEEPSNLPVRQTDVNKTLKKANCTNRPETCTKGKRRAKELDRGVPDENILNRVSPTRKNLNNSRSHRNTSKLIVRKHKSICTAIGKEKNEHKAKTNNKTKVDLAGNVRTMNFSANKSCNLNTVGCINRALWGDMSDISEDIKDEISISEQTQNTEIPFALGLLPLRTALEKMQATPDYQPRKTRSSVALVKQDQEINGLKRKHCNSTNGDSISKKQSNNSNNPNGNANTVCHIQIRTTPPKYSKIRKTTSAHITNLSSVTVTNGQ